MTRTTYAVPLVMTLTLQWSPAKKCFVVANLVRFLGRGSRLTKQCWLTFVVYMGAAIISPAVPLLMRDYGVSEMLGTYAVSAYVIGYAIGPSASDPPLSALTSQWSSRR